MTTEAPADDEAGSALARQAERDLEDLLALRRETLAGRASDDPESDGSAAPPARERSDDERRWSRVGLWLAALWCIWAILPAVAAWNALQSIYAWRVTTGALVLTALAWQ